MNCLNCGKELKRNQTKYCNQQCQADYNRSLKVEKWLNGELDGIRGKTTTSRWIKWHLMNKFGEKCMKCGWEERNPFTGNIPIELDHIDGDFKNNKEGNLRLLCPNCHSLTQYYKGSNKNKGRPRSKYYRGL